MCDVSLFMSASRPKWWKRMYESLQGNKCKWEIVACGPNPPTYNLPENFRYYKCDFKPTQCYMAAALWTNGRIIGWTADDAVYDSKSLDWIVSAYTRVGKKNILTQLTIENKKDVTEEHYFFRNCPKTPMMAPMAFMDRQWFFNLGGYDRNFIAGQAENSIVMDAIHDGGKVKIVPVSKVYLNHEEVHGGIINKIKYKLGAQTFRKGYWHDRRYLEECYVKEGFGTYNEKTLEHGNITDSSQGRLLAHQPYNYENILTVPQGPQGNWGNT